MYLYVYLNTENSFAANRGQLISLCIYAPVLCETRISRLIERHHYSPAFMIYIPEDNVPAGCVTERKTATMEKMRQSADKSDEGSPSGCNMLKTETRVAKDG